MAQRVEHLFKPDYLNLILGAYKRGKVNLLHSVVLGPPHMCFGMCVPHLLQLIIIVIVYEDT